jgi:hypothetical protein
MHIMNNQKQGYSFPAPARLLFGDKIYTDENLFQAPAATFVDGIQLQLSPWASAMIRHQEAIVNLATTLQKDKDMAHLGKQLWEGPMTEFQVGSYVLAKYHSTAGVVQHRGPPNKLLSHLRGPFKVVRHDKDSNTYIIQSLITNREEAIHVTCLRAFIHPADATEASLREVAIRDHQDAFVIEEITAHQGLMTSRREMEFLVRWKGYGPEADKWEPYSELRDTAALHQYLLAQANAKFRRLIPGKFFKNGAYSPDPE